MHHSTLPFHHGWRAAGVLLAGLLAWPAVAAADVSGEAVAFKATVLGTTSALADTGSLPASGGMLQASQVSGGVPSLVGAKTLHATSVSTPDAVTSQASLSDVVLTVGGNTVRVGFMLAQATAPAGSVPTGLADIEALTVNGAPVYVSGQPNQVIALVGGQIMLNEQRITATGEEVVNAVHIAIDGIADVVLASARAGMGGSNVTPPPLPLPPIGGLFGSARPVGQPVQAHPARPRINRFALKQE